MAESDQTKACPLCAETIKVVAKVCPHCRHWQKKWSLGNPRIMAAAGTILLILYSVGMAVFLEQLLGPRRDFAEYRDQIVVISSSMNVSQTEKGRYVSVVGLLTNRSDFTWKEVQLEADYFDKNGKLIDTGLERSFEAVLLSHGEAGFRIRTLADKPESSYVTHKVLVRTAKDIQERF
ncbi:MAG TPA: FxLYD domain-containing protein [Gemmataceae bacterium]|jgi:hypothetical protein|nr:FxLYD domain-containing protein [Gemmataceae bacterium]